MSVNPLLSFELRDTSIGQLYALYPQLAVEQSVEWLAILNRAQMMDTPSGAALAKAGSNCANFMLLLDGAVRIYQEDENVGCFSTVDFV